MAFSSITGFGPLQGTGYSTCGLYETTRFKVRQPRICFRGQQEDCKGQTWGSHPQKGPHFERDYDVRTGHPKYQKLENVSSGSSGIVVKARHKQTGDLVAIKFMWRGKETITKYVERECVNHARLVHPHVIRLHEVILTDKYLGIVLEYAKGGALLDYVRRKKGLSESDARWFFQQLVMGLDYCHKKDISNRDIKLEHILLDSSEDDRRPLLKICDFGHSINELHDSPRSLVGTRGYTAPEVLAGPPPYDAKMADVWSTGVILYAMLFCQHPFLLQGVEGEAQRIMKAQYSCPQHPPVSESCKDLLSRIFVVDPKERISISDMWRHSWLQEGLPGSDLDTLNAPYLRFTMTKDDEDAIRAVVKEAREEDAQQAMDGVRDHAAILFGVPTLIVPNTAGQVRSGRDQSSGKGGAGRTRPTSDGCSR